MCYARERERDMFESWNFKCSLQGVYSHFPHISQQLTEDQNTLKHALKKYCKQRAV